MKKALLVVIDGLSDRVARQECGFLEGQVSGGKARRWQVTAALPTLSTPLYETLHTGLAPAEHGITSNDHRRLSDRPHVFGQVRAAGGKTGAVAHLVFSELYNAAPYEPLRDHEVEDESRPVQFARFFDKSYYTPFNLCLPSDKDLMVKTTLLLRRHQPNYFLLHTLSCDSVGHAYGGNSKEYRHQAWMVDDQLAQFLPLWLEEGYRVLVTADHGMNDDGNHGGTADEVRLVPLYEFGGDKVGEAGSADQLAIAPTLLHRIGLRAPATMRHAALD